MLSTHKEIKQKLNHQPQLHSKSIPYSAIFITGFQIFLFVENTEVL